jgi:glycosyltransferase involved in cell wall biosynthesis
MEGMACGLPAVATRISGIPELVEDGENGFLVPPRDPEALADALARLASNPELRRRMGRAARAKVLQEFDLEANAARLAAMIRAVPGSSNGNGSAHAEARC